MEFIPITDASIFSDFVNLAFRNKKAKELLEKGKIELFHIDKNGRINLIGKDPIEDDEKLAEEVEKWLIEDGIGQRYWNGILKKYFPNEIPISHLVKNVSFTEREKEFEEKLVKELKEEIKKIEIKKKRIFGIISRNEIFNYEEIFHKKLGKYGVHEIYDALIRLENEASGREKEKIKAVRRVYEKKEGMRKGKKYALILSALLLAGLGGYAIYNFYIQPNRPPEGGIGGSQPAPTPTIPTPEIYSLTFLKLFQLIAFCQSM